MKDLILPLGISENSGWFYKMHCDAWFLCSKRRIKTLGFIASLGLDNFVVQNLITFSHSHKAWVRMGIQIHTGDTDLCVLWIYNLGALPGFQGAYEHCSFSGKPWTSHMAQKPVRNVLKIHEMLKIWPDMFIIQCSHANYLTVSNSSTSILPHNCINTKKQQQQQQKKEIKEFEWIKPGNTKDVLLTVELSLLFISCLATREFWHTILSFFSSGTPIDNAAYKLFPYNL